MVTDAEKEESILQQAGRQKIKTGQVTERRMAAGLWRSSHSLEAPGGLILSPSSLRRCPTRGDNCILVFSTDASYVQTSPLKLQVPSALHNNLPGG